MAARKGKSRLTKLLKQFDKLMKSGRLTKVTAKLKRKNNGSKLRRKKGNKKKKDVRSRKSKRS